MCKVEQTKVYKKVPKSLIPLIKKDYLESGKSIREISIKYQVSERALAVRATRENWKVKEVEIVQNIVKNVQKREDLRLELLRKHEEEMLLRMRKRLDLVDFTYEQIGNLVEPGDLSSLVKTESTIDQVVRRNLGAEEKIAVDVTSGGQSIVDILTSVRALNAKPDAKTVDVSVEVMQDMLKQGLVEG